MRLRNVKDKLDVLNSNHNYVADPSLYKGKWGSVFGNNNPICLEIGSGKLKFITEMAKKYPNINFIGIERSDSVLALGMKSNDTNLDNLRLICYNAALINELFDSEIDTLYLNFSDPWPKSRHFKRRLTYKGFLEKYDLIFKNDCKIVQKTDNQNLFEFSLVSLSMHGYVLEEVNLDLQNSEINDNITTEYEEKFMGHGCKIYRLVAVKRKK